MDNATAMTQGGLEAGASDTVDFIGPMQAGKALFRQSPAPPQNSVKLQNQLEIFLNQARYLNYAPTCPKTKTYP